MSTANGFSVYIISSFTIQALAKVAKWVCLDKAEKLVMGRLTRTYRPRREEVQWFSG